MIEEPGWQISDRNDPPSSDHGIKKEVKVIVKAVVAIPPFKTTTCETKVIGPFVEQCIIYAPNPKLWLKLLVSMPAGPDGDPYCALNIGNERV